MTYKATVTETDKTSVIQKLRTHNSEDSRISVELMCQELNMPRRKLRSIVHVINADDTDHLILTDTDCGGYWLASRGSDPQAAVSNYWEEESRAMNTLRKVQAMKHKINRLYGSQALDVNAKLQEGLW